MRIGQRRTDEVNLLRCAKLVVFPCEQKMEEVQAVQDGNTYILTVEKLCSEFTVY